MKQQTNKQRNIVLSLFLAAIFLTALTGNAQTDSLAWDETQVSVLSKTYKIVTENDIIPLELIREFGDKATSYIMKNRKDRHGAYKSFTFYFPLEMRQELDYFIDHIQRPKNN